MREEHRAALDWLNNNTAANRSFYGVLVGALRIDDSNPAVNFRVLVSPNTFQKVSAQTARDLESSPDQQQLNAVFNRIYDLVKSSGRFGRLLKPLGYLSYYVVERTHSSVEYSVVFSRESVRAEVALNFPEASMNAHLFNALKARAKEVEQTVQGDVLWDFKDGRKRQVLRVSRPVDRERLAEESEGVAVWAADRLLELREGLEPGLEMEVRSARSGPVA